MNLLSVLYPYHPVHYFLSIYLKFANFKYYVFLLFTVPRESHKFDCNLVKYCDCWIDFGLKNRRNYCQQGYLMSSMSRFIRIPSKKQLCYITNLFMHGHLIL